jgi:hypothetical protein
MNRKMPTETEEKDIGDDHPSPFRFEVDGRRSLDHLKCLAKLGGFSTIFTHHYPRLLGRLFATRHRFANLPRPHTPKSYRFRLPSCAPPTSINHRSCRVFSLGCGKFPPSAIPAAFAPATQFSVDPRHPSRGSHFRSLPSTIREPYCTFQHMAIIPQHLVPSTLPTAKCN